MRPLPTPTRARAATRALALPALLVATGAVAGACGTPEPLAGPSTTIATKSVEQSGFFEREIWQTDLKVVGCYAGEVDGKVLPPIDAALRAFQQAAGLTADGTYGPATDAALKKAVREGTTVCKVPTTAPPTTAPPTVPGSVPAPSSRPR